MAAATSMRAAWVPTAEESETTLDVAQFKAEHANEMAEKCASMVEHWRQRAEYWLAQSDRYANVAILDAAVRANKGAGRRRVHVASQGAKR